MTTRTKIEVVRFDQLGPADRELWREAEADQAGGRIVFRSEVLDVVPREGTEEIQLRLTATTAAALESTARRIRLELESQERAGLSRG